MSYLYEDRLSGSELVESIWHTIAEEAGRYLAVADASWDFLIVRQRGQTQIHVAGAATAVAPITYEVGTEYIGIRMRVGTYMPHWPASDLVDSMHLLQCAGRDTFWMQDETLPLPDYNTVEPFIERLVRKGLLEQDPVIAAYLEGEAPGSLRSLQRRYLRATGMSPSYHQVIERARKAQDLLLKGQSILDTVFELGYSDQPHLTKALKRYLGQTPGQLARAAQAPDS